MGFGLTQTAAQTIDRLLQENKDKIASLQRAAAQLRKANLRIDGLEKMIADLNKQLAGKKDEIARLRELVPGGARVLVTYGQGSVLRNGVLDQVRCALADHARLEWLPLETIAYRDCHAINRMRFDLAPKAEMIAPAWPMVSV